MKVAFLIGSLNRGGAESLLVDIANHHTIAPFEMMVICRKGGEYVKEILQTDIPYFQLAPSIGKYLSYILQLRKVLETNKIDIIHSYYWLDTIFGKLAILGLPIKIITTFHGYFGYAKDISWWNKIYYKLTIVLSDIVCFVSNYAKQGFLTNFRNVIGNKGRVLYNGIDMHKFVSPNTSKSNIYDVYNDETVSLSKTGIKLCMVGSFSSVRSQLVVCKALDILNTKALKSNYDFYFIGGRYPTEEWRYDQCVDFCSEHKLTNVHFMGVCDNVPKLLQQMDGFVYSTYNDTFGIAVVEAMASGLPVIVNDHPVMKEITHDGDWVTLYEDNNEIDCANKIQELIENLPEYKAKAQHIAQKVRSEYSIDKHIERSTELYNSIR